MDYFELARTCADRVTAAAEIGTPAEEAAVLLTTPKGWKPPPRFPRGRMIQVKPNGDRLSYFPALKTLAWLVAHSGGRIRVESAPPTAPAAAPGSPTSASPA